MEEDRRTVIETLAKVPATAGDLAALLAEVDAWLARYRVLWEQRLDALHTEIVRRKRQRRSTS